MARKKTNKAFTDSAASSQKERVVDTDTARSLAKNDKGALYFPPGRYVLNNTLALGKLRDSGDGDGWSATVA